MIVQVRPGHALALRSRPFGPVLARVGSTTQFGSPQSFSVVGTRRGRWLAVTEAGVGNNRVVWVDARSGGLRYAAHTTASSTSIFPLVRSPFTRDGATVRRLSVGRRPCRIADSDRPLRRHRQAERQRVQRRVRLLHPRAFRDHSRTCLPAGAVATASPSTARFRPSDFGRAVSAGCVHASDSDLRYLMRAVPLGTPSSFDRKHRLEAEERAEAFGLGVDRRALGTV